jgi:hypothetical protein
MGMYTAWTASSKAEGKTPDEFKVAKQGVYPDVVL